MFEACVIKGKRFVPARFCAPLAGYTHSAFRRLVAELGACGALWTEMLAARQILSENFTTSPWLRRRPEEGLVFFQLMANSGDPLGRVLDRLGENGVEAVDLNLACNANSIRVHQAGSALFENLPALQAVVGEVRRHWPGILTAKIRLGRQSPDWQARLSERLHLLEETGVDAIILHPRFFEDKFKRRARLEWIPWAASMTRLPLIANGDLCGPETVQEHIDHLRFAAAVMLGRMAIVRPWVFAHWDISGAVHYLEIWRKIYQYITEDFPPVVALRRIKMFNKYFAANFLFGHQFNVAVSKAATLEEALTSAEQFLARNPALVVQPTVAGL